MHKIMVVVWVVVLVVVLHQRPGNVFHGFSIRCSYTVMAGNRRMHRGSHPPPSTNNEDNYSESRTKRLVEGSNNSSHHWSRVQFC